MPLAKDEGTKYRRVFKTKVSGLDPYVIFTSVHRNCWFLLLFLQHCPELWNTSVCFHMENKTAVWCIDRQASAWLEILLAVSEVLFDLAHSSCLCLAVLYLPDRQNIGADDLSRFAETSAEWILLPQMFHQLRVWFDQPEIDLFCALMSHLLPPTSFVSLALKPRVQRPLQWIGTDNSTFIFSLHQWGWFL